MALETSSKIVDPVSSQKKQWQWQIYKQLNIIPNDVSKKKPIIKCEKSAYLNFYNQNLHDVRSNINIFCSKKMFNNQEEIEKYAIANCAHSIRTGDEHSIVDSNNFYFVCLFRNENLPFLFISTGSRNKYYLILDYFHFETTNVCTFVLFTFYVRRQQFCIESISKR